MPKMGRGRNKSVSNERLLMEMLLADTKLVRVKEIAPNVAVGPETVRKRMREELEPRGYVEIEGNGTNFYRMTDEGYEWLAGRLRKLVD